MSRSVGISHRTSRDRDRDRDRGTANTAFSVRVTGKSVSDASAGPAMVFTHTQRASADAAVDSKAHYVPLGTTSDRTRELYPQTYSQGYSQGQGQRAASTGRGPRGRSIVSSQTRPQSGGDAGRSSSAAAARPGRVSPPAPAAAPPPLERKSVSRASPPRGGGFGRGTQAHENSASATLLSRYASGNSNGDSAAVATVNSVVADERYNIDNELKRSAHSAARHRAEKAEVSVLLPSASVLVSVSGGGSQQCRYCFVFYLYFICILVTGASEPC
jgi:hypothetical protein